MPMYSIRHRITSNGYRWVQLREFFHDLGRVVDGGAVRQAHSLNLWFFEECEDPKACTKGRGAKRYRLRLLAGHWVLQVVQINRQKVVHL